MIVVTLLDIVTTYGFFRGAIIMSIKFLKIKEFPDMVQLSYYNHHILKQKSNFTSQVIATFSENIRKSEEFKKNESKRCSCSRTLTTMKDLLYCNDFDYFLTFTFKDEIRYDYLKAAAIFKQALITYKKKSPSPQRQK